MSRLTTKFDEAMAFVATNFNPYSDTPLDYAQVLNEASRAYSVEVEDLIVCFDLEEKERYEDVWSDFLSARSHFRQSFAKGVDSGFVERFAKDHRISTSFLTGRMLSVYDCTAGYQTKMPEIKI